MRRLPWLVVPVLFVVACGSDVEPTVLDVAKGTVVLKTAPARDPVVRVTGPSTVYVEQSNRMRFMWEWPHKRAGEVTVPLRALDDGSGPLTIGLLPRFWPGAATPAGTPDLRTCPECAREHDVYVRCCMSNPDK